MSYTFSDNWRNDGFLNAVSLSIHSINQRMFSKVQSESHCAWVILEIDARVLWNHACRFCWANASSSEMVNHSGFIGGPWAFARMFADRPASHSDERSFREVYGRSSNMPTNNDAEVQVLSPIGPNLIRDLTVKSGTQRVIAEAAMKAAGRVLPIAVVPEVFC